MMELIAESTPCYSLKLTLAMLSRYSPPALDRVEDEAYARAFLCRGGAELAIVRQVRGSSFKIQCTSRSAAELAARTLSFTLDLEGFYRSIRDPVLKAAASRLRGLRVKTSPTAFEAIAESIVEQQISLRAAVKVKERLVKALGEKLAYRGSVYYTFPSQEAVAAASVGELRGLGLPKRRAECLKRVAELQLEDLPGKPPDLIVSELTEVKGVGEWTAKLAAARMGRLTVLPASDLGLRKAVGALYLGRLASRREVEEIAEGWGSLKALAAFYLIAYWMGGGHGLQ
ncbi:MAG: hypothetical protein DRN96_05330 [Thermoproteota archaeon]|nr:MAG: hypothetical protein DRN96_05330 [Candidatus Korarchaeota archaeon]